MQVESTRYRASEVMSDWQTDLKEVDRKRRAGCSQLSRKGQLILIDYGSDTIKAGFGCSIQPELVFKSLTSKAKQSLAATFVNTINFSYEQLDFLKSNYRSPFDRNVIQHFSALEHCNDFVFSSLGCADDNVRSPLVVSETPANPIYCRTQLLEMLFECYGVPEVFIGCDALFAYFHELDCQLKDLSRDTRLIVSFGAAATHVIPVVEGKMDYNAIKRLNLGTNNCLEAMGKLVTLKNPQLKQHLTYPVIKHIFNKFSCVAADYKEQLIYFKSEGEPVVRSSYKNRIVQENNKFAKPPVIGAVEIEFERPGFDISVEQLKRREQIKKRMAERLKEALQRKRQEKQRIFRSEYEQLCKLRDKYEADPENNKEELTETFGEEKPEQLLKRKLRFLEAKLEIEPKDEQKKFALIDIPDNELPPEKQRLKKLQIYQKASLEQRRKKKELELEQQRQMKQLREQNPEKYLEELRTKYNALHARMKETERIKSELANRNSRLNQRRMQTLAQLAEDNEQDDNFGDNEDDWMLYRAQQEEDHRSEMQALEVELRQIDPSWMVDTDRHHLNTGYTLHLASELIRPCEAYFQPYMLGNDQMSLPDIIALVVARYPPEIRRILLSRILLVSGGCRITGLRERLLTEVVSRSEAGTQVDIKVAREPQLGCFLGMRGLAAKYSDYVRQNSIKRSQWMQGSLPTKEHYFARLHF